MDPLGCDDCRQGLSNRDDSGFLVTDCASSFRPVDSYFSARLKRCSTCDTTSLEGYHEDFTDTDVMDEWGKRIFIWRPLSEDQIAEIAKAQGTSSLDVDTFAI